MLLMYVTNKNYHLLSLPSVYFNLLTSCGVRLAGMEVSLVNTIFQSTHPMRGETGVEHAELADRDISIHSPHAG